MNQLPLNQHCENAYRNKCPQRVGEHDGAEAGVKEAGKGPFSRVENQSRKEEEGGNVEGVKQVEQCGVLIPGR